MSVPDDVGKGGESKSSAVTNATQALSKLPALTQQKASVFAVLFFGLSVTGGLFTAGLMACTLASKHQAKRHQQQLSQSSVSGAAFPTDSASSQPAGLQGLLGSTSHMDNGALSGGGQG